MAKKKSKSVKKVAVRERKKVRVVCDKSGGKSGIMNCSSGIPSYLCFKNARKRYYCWKHSHISKQASCCRFAWDVDNDGYLDETLENPSLSENELSSFSRHRKSERIFDGVVFGSTPLGKEKVSSSGRGEMTCANKGCPQEVRRYCKKGKNWRCFSHYHFRSCCDEVAGSDYGYGYPYDDGGGFQEVREEVIKKVKFSNG